MPYHVKNLRFAVEAVAEGDEPSVVVVAAPGTDLHVAIRTRPVLEGGFQSTLDDERAATLRLLPDAKLMERTGLTLLGREARMVIYAAQSADGLPVRFHQAFVLDDDEVVVLSALGQERRRDEVRDLFEKILAEAQDAG